MKDESKEGGGPSRGRGCVAQAEGTGTVGSGALGLRGSGWSGVCDGDQSSHEGGDCKPRVSPSREKAQCGARRGSGRDMLPEFAGGEKKKNPL